MTSPHYPTLSQPLSDMSSVTPSSVFNESSVVPPQRYPHNRSPVSPVNANPYEVPNDSESGHHSVSPPGHTHHSSRRPHTANAMMSSQPAFYPSSSHSRTPPLTQSNVELFQFHPPPIPPHRSNTVIGAMQMSNHVRSASPRIPEEGDYSEIPESPKEKPFDGHSSPDSSGQYDSYSDIPTAISPPLEGGSKNFKSSPGHSSTSESISSFSTDSQSTSPVRRGGDQRLGSNISYRGEVITSHNGNIPRCASHSSGRVVEVS